MADKLNAAKLIFKKHENKDSGYRNSSYLTSQGGSNFNIPGGSPFVFKSYKQIPISGNSGIPFSGGPIISVYPQHGLSHNGGNSSVHSYISTPPPHQQYVMHNEFESKKNHHEDDSFLMNKKAELLQSFKSGSNTGVKKVGPDNSSIFSQTRIINNYGNINIGVSSEPKGNIHQKQFNATLDAPTSSPMHKKTRSLAEISKKIDRMINLNNQMKDTAGMLGSQKGTPKREITNPFLDIGNGTNNYFYSDLLYSKSNSNPPGLSNLIKEQFYHSARNNKQFYTGEIADQKGYNSHNPNLDSRLDISEGHHRSQTHDGEISGDDLFRNHEITIEGDLELLKKIHYENSSKDKMAKPLTPEHKGLNPKQNPTSEISPFVSPVKKQTGVPPKNSVNYLNLQDFSVANKKQTTKNFDSIDIKRKFEFIDVALGLDMHALTDYLFSEALQKAPPPLLENGKLNEISSSTSNMLLLTEIFHQEEKPKSLSMSRVGNKMESIPEAKLAGAHPNRSSVKITNQHIEMPHQKQNSIIKVISPDAEILEETETSTEARSKKMKGVKLVTSPLEEEDSYYRFTLMEVNKALSAIYNKVIFRSVSNLKEKSGLDERRKTYLEEFIRAKEEDNEPKYKTNKKNKQLFTGEFYRDEVEILARDIETKAPLRRVYEDFEKSRPEMFITIENLNVLYENTLMMLITNKIDNKLLDEEIEEEEDQSPCNQNSLSNRSSFEDRPRQVTLTQRVSFMEEIIGCKSLNFTFSYNY